LFTTRWQRVFRGLALSVRSSPCVFLDYSKLVAVKKAKKKAPAQEPGPKREEEKITQKGAEILP